VRSLQNWPIFRLFLIEISHFWSFIFQNRTLLAEPSRDTGMSPSGYGVAYYATLISFHSLRLADSVGMRPQGEVRRFARHSTPLPYATPMAIYIHRRVRFRLVRPLTRSKARPNVLKKYRHRSNRVSFSWQNQSSWQAWRVNFFYTKSICWRIVRQPISFLFPRMVRRT
jgi:hypothetical protein